MWNEAKPTQDPITIGRASVEAPATFTNVRFDPISPVERMTDPDTGTDSSPIHPPQATPRSSVSGDVDTIRTIPPQWL